MMDETIEIKRKRLYMRSIRRGIKEMDLILQAFAEAELGKMDAPVWTFTIDFCQRATMICINGLADSLRSRKSIGT